MATGSEYHQATVDITGDPLIVMASLARAMIDEPHVLYEANGTFGFAVRPMAELTVTGDNVTLRDDQGAWRAVAWSQDPLKLVGDLMQKVRIPGWRAYGIATFELSYALAGMHDHIGDGLLLHLIVPASEVRITGRQAVIRSVDLAELDSMIRLVTARHAEPEHQPLPVDIVGSFGPAYRDAVNAAVRDITDGKLQKVILSRSVPVPQKVDLVGSYITGRRANNPARSFLLNLGGIRATGFSPEIVVKVDRSGRVTTQPLAGTRRAGADTAEGERLRAELLSDAKELYEHAISVKVAWDELTDLCEPDTVTVEEYMTIRHRGSVNHLASRLSGMLPRRLGPWQAMAALFPAVTASGVPKRAAYECIRRHEPGDRGLYAGAVLTVDDEGILDAALVLRSLYEQHGKTWLRAGAGIVAQSSADREFEETCEKLRSVAPNLVRGAETVRPSEQIA